MLTADHSATVSVPLTTPMLVDADTGCRRGASALHAQSKHIPTQIFFGQQKLSLRFKQAVIMQGRIHSLSMAKHSMAVDTMCSAVQTTKSLASYSLMRRTELSLVSINFDEMDEISIE